MSYLNYQASTLVHSEPFTSIHYHNTVKLYCMLNPQIKRDGILGGDIII